MQVFYRQSSPEKKRDGGEHKTNCITPARQEEDIKPAVIQLIRERGVGGLLMHEKQRHLQWGTRITSRSVTVER